MKRCEKCGLPQDFPSPEAIGLKLDGANRGWVTARIYQVLQRPAGVTVQDICKAAWPDGAQRSDESIHVMLNRLDKRLSRYGLGIARVGIAHRGRTYRLVGL